MTLSKSLCEQWILFGEYFFTLKHNFQLLKGWKNSLAESLLIK